MFAIEVIAIGLAVISIGYQPINGFDLSKLREDPQRRQLQQTPEADSYDEPPASEINQHWDNDKNPDFRKAFEQIFPVASDVRHRDNNPPQRPPWDMPDDDGEYNVDELDDDTYRIRKRFYVPSVSCDFSSIRHGAGPGSHHGNGVAKLMRMPRRHRRSAEENEANRRRRTNKEDDETEQRGVKVSGNELLVTTEDKASDSKDNNMKRILARRRRDDDDDGIDNEDQKDPEQISVNQATKGNSGVRRVHPDEWQRELNRIATNDPVRNRPHSLLDMLDLQRKLRYEGIQLQMASDQREDVAGDERERNKLTPSRPTHLPDDAI